MSMSGTMDRTQVRAKWVTVAAAVAVVWYAFGLLQFWLGYTVDTAAAVASGAMTPAHAAAVDGTPFGVWLAFALASGAGVVGAVLLAVGSPRAALVFAVSAVSALAYYAWVYGISGTGGDRPAQELVIGVVVVGVTLGFLALSRRAT